MKHRGKNNTLKTALALVMVLFLTAGACTGTASIKALAAEEEITLEEEVEAPAPAEEVVTPEEEVEAPAPAEEVVTPEEEVEAPAPAEEVVTPEEEVEAPAPAEEIVTPEEEVEAPAPAEEVITEEAAFSGITEASVNAPRLIMGTGALVKGSVVYMGTKDTTRYKWGDTNARPAWIVLDPQKTNAGGNGIFLLSRELIGNKTGTYGGIAFDDNSSDWFASNARNTWCADFMTNVFAGEQAAVLAVSKTDERTTLYDYTWNPSKLQNDKVFFLSAREVYDYISPQNGNALSAKLGSTPGQWWLRSPWANGMNRPARVAGTSVLENAVCTSEIAARPALNFNPDAVLFSSAAVDGKKTVQVSNLCMKKVENADITGWKFTLKDDGSAASVGSGHAGFQATRLSFDGNTLRFSYSGAKTGANEYISAIITDSTQKTVRYYGRIARAESASGEASVWLSGMTKDGGRVFIFNEQFNGDYQTDYASALREMPLTIYVTGVTLDKTALTLPPGSTEKLYAGVDPRNATNQNVTWTSSDSAVATVAADGTVKTLKEGTAVITVTSADGGKTATCTVNVKTVIPVEDITLNTTSATLKVGESLQLSTTITPANATDKTIYWSADGSAVTVSDLGLVKAVKAGTSVVRATSSDGNAIATCTVTVTAVAKTPDELTKDFITRAYREILSRTPDTSGMNYWFGELKAKRLGGGMMVAQFLNSREFLNKKYDSGKTMDIMYRVYMDRAPEKNGLMYWKDYLDNGLSVIYVAKGFTASAEFQNICKSYGIDPGTVALTQNRDQNEKVTRFVSRCYKESLGRNGEESGLNYWTGELLARRITPAKVAEQFVFSKEMNSKGYDNSRFIQMLYRLCMGRKYDQAGLNYWLGQMGKGMTRQQVFTHFVNSREFQNIVKSYGL